MIIYLYTCICVCVCCVYMCVGVYTLISQFMVYMCVGVCTHNNKSVHGIYVCRCMHTNKSVHGICLIQFSVDKFEGRLILLQTCKHEDCMCMCIWAILQ